MMGWRRWWTFNLVGVLGFALQLTLLFLIKRFLGLSYLVATVLAVEGAVLHNFLWHEHLSWADVTAYSRGRTLQRVVRFHAANGLISIAGNAALTWGLVEKLHVPYMAANAVAVLACSAVNYIACDRFVFGKSPPTLVGMVRSSIGSATYF
jgi:putative flippase GtrA